MNKVAILAVFVAVTLTATAHAASAPKGHKPGDPIKQGSYCWVYTDARGAGWWDACDPNTTLSPRGKSLRGRSEADISGIENGGGGDGGGGGGGK